MKNIYIILVLLFWLIFSSQINAQDLLGGKISGSFQLDAQTYFKDDVIGAKDVNEKILSNSFLYLNYNAGNFNAGLRYEAYLNTINGIDKLYNGSGIGYKFAEYTTDFFDATVGNFYEQFGSGMILRAYEDRQLGIDNSLEGLRFRLRPVKGIEFVGLLGKQRSFWTLGEGIVRGGNLSVSVNSLCENLLPQDYQLNLGGGVVSKYQDTKDSTLPKNVLAYSTRLSLSAPNFMFESEYAYKYNDPSAMNKQDYSNGQGLMLTASYFPSGFGITANFHTVNNMDFRSDRNATANNLTLSFYPPLTKQHLYRLASLYPFTTQLNGEIGIQGEVTYSIPKALFGDKYGATLTMNYSQINSVDKTPDKTAMVGDSLYIYTYNSKMFSFGNTLYFRDFSFELSKTWNPGLKTIISYVNSKYNMGVIEIKGAGFVESNIAIGEMVYSLTKKQSLRLEVQHIWTKQDDEFFLEHNDKTNGNWAFGLVEYSVAPTWFISLYDMYNYGNIIQDKKAHYLGANIAFIHNTTRVSLGYGRQRGGLLCVGGVCRLVPPSNGFLFSISSSF